MAAACALAAATEVRAQAEASFGFEWTAPDGCPSADAVEARIDGLLGGRAAERTKQVLRVRAEVARDELWRVTLDTLLAEAHGHRTLESSTCEGIANATALIVALMIDPTAVANHAPEASEATERKPTVAPPPPLSPVSTPRTTFLLVGAGATGTLGLLPAPDAVLSGEIGAVGPGWRVELRAGYGVRHVSSDERAGGHGEFHQIVLATLNGCLTGARGIAEVGACADVESGVVHGTGVGTRDASDEYQPWLAAGAGAFVALRVSRSVAFPIHVDAMVPLWRPTYVFTNVETPIFRAWAVGARLSAAVELRF
jgi:hypothetical protein